MATVKPTVAIITPGLGLGGAEQWIRCLVTHCSQFRWVVGVQHLGNWSPVIGDAVVAHAAAVHTTPGIARGVTMHANVADMVAATVESADVVIVWGGGDYWPLPTTAPVVFVGHGSCQWSLAVAVAAAEAGVTHFTAVSGLAADSLRQVNPAVVTIWNGVDESRLAPPVDIAAVREKWKPNTHEYAKYVGYLGRLSNDKNLDSVIHAMAALPHHYHLVLIGCEGVHRDRILTLARNTLAGRLIEVSATDAVGVPLWSLDCMVLVSPREGHSLAICEGMLCWIPIVSTRVGAIPELEQRAGRDLVESVPDDPLSCEIAASIRKVCTEFPTERVKAAAIFAKQHLTATVMCAKWTEYLQDLIRKFPVQHPGSPQPAFTAGQVVRVVNHALATRGLQGYVRLVDRHGQVWVSPGAGCRDISFAPVDLRLVSTPSTGGTPCEGSLHGSDSSGGSC